MKTILAITDGIGYSKETEYNAFFHANKPNYEKLFKEVPYGMIKTYGLSVGLPDGQMGNSEVGHMCIGSGRILYQDLVKINKAIESGELLKNKALQSLKNTKKIHVIGLASDGGVHSHIDHINALAFGLKDSHEIYLHLISDGRDVLPQSALGFVQSILEKIQGTNIKVASLCGRFYAMDRDNRWDRVERAYNTIALGENLTDKTPLEYIETQYSKEIFDEFIEPVSFIGESFSKDDGIIFVNFRSDRAREIVSALGIADFSSFVRKGFVELPLVTMTQYDKNFNFPVMFPKDSIQNTLAEIISKNNLRQFHTAETEKYAHVTFFFNGGIEEPYNGEDRILIPSPKVKTYDEKPEMSAFEVCDEVLKAMDMEYDFIVVNFANGDMVGHTGSLSAAIKAVEAVDTQIGRIYEKSKEKEYALILTSDHGNCEEMQNNNGEILTNHTIGEVWAFISAPNVKSVKNGGLNNIAPSVLKLMGLEIPKEMDTPLF
ncbi:2,3-bisphosphoglycerate-independent phosphoglycerate mutase [Helicobacter sp. WB40]|uniref:2,3-bisphosphoglycerate-independent phosphoglycerate mutase n=1 Tax=Helicobacter sp. WB40 TaxID=3004130 RepID=UPI0022EBE162|nr:2,3-bisphosphoglycerate-independent phosphoglycerate mutase [Helicobacter sp. WB40]MDA3967124.1 2,3-bisphosphoglycerate-independent phosphoglycerate mutase [Helicobacter sp. WB40]